MRKRQDTLCARGCRCFLLCLMLALVAPAAEAQLVLFDDFAAARLDAEKWAGRQFITRDGGSGNVLEIQREATGQAVVLLTRVVGGTASDSGSFSAENALAFRRARNLTEILFTARVRQLELAGCAAGSGAEAGVRGVFALFNDGLGDVVATIGMSRSSASAAPAEELTVVASLERRTAEGTTPLGSVVLGSAAVGQNVRLRMRWEPARNRVRFQRETDALVAIDYSVAAASAPDRARKYLGAIASAGECASAAASALVEASIGAVRVNQ